MNNEEIPTKPKYGSLKMTQFFQSDEREREKERSKRERT